MKKIMALVIVVVAITTSACGGVNMAVAMALAERELGGKAVHTFEGSSGTKIVLVCASNKIHPVIVYGSATDPKVRGFRAQTIGLCGEPQELWGKYDRAKSLDDGAAKAAMAALQEAVREY